MALTLTNETKNTVTLTLEAKVSNTTKKWDPELFTWVEEGTATWDDESFPLHLESKNTVTLTNETKN